MMHCWALKMHLENLVQHGYLEEFILDQEEDPKVRGTQLTLSTKALTPGRKARQEAMKLFSLKNIHV